MARSARSLDEPERWSLADAAASLAGMVARNPMLVGGSTAFIVALSFVSANALWYQPHAHSGAFFATRDLLREPAPEEPMETTIVIERPEPVRQAAGDPVVKRVQGTLKELNFYAGEVDGIYGPNTRLAIETYQSKMGLAVTGALDDELLDHLGADPVASIMRPSPAPRAETAQPAAAKPEASRAQLIARIQAGLREFGNDDIEVDGLLGAKTEAAIREFQSLFDLPQTGRADDDVYARMKEIGLIQ